MDFAEILATVANEIRDRTPGAVRVFVSLSAGSLDKHPHACVSWCVQAYDALRSQEASVAACGIGRTLEDAEADCRAEWEKAMMGAGICCPS